MSEGIILLYCVSQVPVLSPEVWGEWVRFPLFWDSDQPRYTQDSTQQGRCCTILKTAFRFDTYVHPCYPNVLPICSVPVLTRSWIQTMKQLRLLLNVVYVVTRYVHFCIWLLSLNVIYFR